MNKLTELQEQLNKIQAELNELKEEQPELPEVGKLVKIERQSLNPTVYGKITDFKNGTFRIQSGTTELCASVEFIKSWSYLIDRPKWYDELVPGMPCWMSGDEKIWFPRIYWGSNDGWDYCEPWGSEKVGKV